jgi:hypothetical protein
MASQPKPEAGSPLDPGAGGPASRQLTELLGKALLDHELCDRLFMDPEAVAREFGLPVAETEAVKRLDRRTFERIMQSLYPVQSL